MRVFYYVHDTYGFRYIRQTLAVAQRVASDFPESTQLLVSGLPQPSSLKLPNHFDLIKLPGMGAFSGTENHMPSLSLSMDKIKTMREMLILEVIKHFNPDLVLVGESPVGIRDEIISSLRYIKRKQPDTQLVFGLCHVYDRIMMVSDVLQSVKSANTLNISSPTGSSRNIQINPVSVRRHRVLRASH